MDDVGPWSAVQRAAASATMLAGLLFGALAGPAQAAPMGARDRLPAATAEARAWQKDARLVRVETKKVNAHRRCPDRF